jgi:hypothetical protein
VFWRFSIAQPQAECGWWGFWLQLGGEEISGAGMQELTKDTSVGDPELRSEDRSLPMPRARECVYLARGGLFSYHQLALTCYRGQKTS